ncbi:hypothetical protein H1P_670008 [Hyella patelloides LEGE 07179]|uniref:Uncharacterized protein n=1 Tax=Hyella patelloides LEGE 07179 TaxID=945734 RepID=A0A563W2U3_9CYAN|nr:hypothetical protein H1P_670008 [Hyella patelloides LEGE 07179]
MILTKIDLLPSVQFDVNRCLEYAQQVNLQISIFQVSATTGAGLNNWYYFIIKLNCCFLLFMFVNRFSFHDAGK